MIDRSKRIGVAVVAGLLAALALYLWGPLPGGARARELGTMRGPLRPLHKKMRRPGPNDWLANHDEPGQSFRDYLRCDPTLPTPGRRTIYVQPLGEFTTGQRRAVDLTAEFIGIYFDLPVVIADDLPLSVVPGHYRRRLRSTLR